MRFGWLAALLVMTAVPAAAQAPAPGWDVASREAVMPQWQFRQGESWSSLRSPSSGFFVSIGGFGGISTSTTLRNVGTLGCPAGALTLGCDPNAPRGDLGTGGGGAFGIGARVTPVFRTAIVFAAEGGYRFSGDLPQAFGLFNETVRVSVRSFQTTVNLYGDLGGVLNLGRWNPYLTGGIGVAANQTGDTQVSFGAIGGPQTGSVTTPSSATRASFLWTAGAGLQYQLTGSSALDLSYQYVDAGSFRTGSLEGPGLALEGHLRTHRIGIAVVLNLGYLAQLAAGR